ncbi:peptidase C39 family protein, partial [Enterococcus gallinarum]|nr:peptidase C39 family protein [Enterococcus gallinarum]
NDPNDSEEKGHSKRTFTAEEVMNEALNFWAFY